ncbi:MAG: hypothetical protein RMK78_00405 [Thermaurantiacus sp.]|uniref:hypothetical protein n=1 Tax=Thermaurantiacus sp. TaxID=2820283 RepID=UPI00298ED7F6|nr:hypothetical protein [Thermaurantiacus sp.]MDW8413921.1 hypothetical protein [Thermaurantiacus sp.]
MANGWRVLALALALGACVATKEARVRRALMEAGVPEPVARCMARPMAEDLSVAQLRALADAARLARRPVGEVTVAEAFRALRRVGDPQVIGTLAATGLSCAGHM